MESGKSTSFSGFCGGPECQPKPELGRLYFPKPKIASRLGPDLWIDPIQRVLAPLAGFASRSTGQRWV